MQLFIMTSNYLVLSDLVLYLCHSINQKFIKMKKNLRNVLALTLGLITTVASAQDWNVDSRTRIDMSGENSKMLTEQRATLGATWGADDWGIHLSSDVNYELETGVASINVYEAYTSANNLLMGYVNLTAGRMALDYGSGALMSSNQWGATRTTWDGLKFGINNDFLGLTIGMASKNDGGDDSTVTSSSNIYVNASKEVAGLDVNLLYMMGSSTASGTEGDATSALGLDLGYGLMDGALNLAVSYNMQDSDADSSAAAMMNVGATYQVMDALTAGVSYTSYTGDKGFAMDGTNMSGGWANGNMGYLGANDQDIAIDVAYALTNLNIGLGYHMVSNSEDTDYERSVIDLSVGYTISDNASLGLRYATDATSIASVDATTNYTWVTLSVRP